MDPQDPAPPPGPEPIEAPPPIVDPADVLDPRQLVTRLVPDESEVAHRAFLLWGMQNSGDGHKTARSIRLVSRALADPRDEKLLRRWHTSFCWESRARNGRSGEIHCLREYARCYEAGLGHSETSIVARNVRIGPTDREPIPRPNKPAPRASLADAVKQVKAAEERELTEAQKTRKALRGLAVGTMQVFQNRLKNTEHPLAVRASDLRSIAEVLAMTEEPVSPDGPAQGPAMVESVKVRTARANGTPVLAAALEDVQDLVVILTHLTRKTDESAVSADESAAGADSADLGGGR